SAVGKVHLMSGCGDPSDAVRAWCPRSCWNIGQGLEASWPEARSAEPRTETSTAAAPIAPRRDATLVDRRCRPALDLTCLPLDLRTGGRDKRIRSNGAGQHGPA